MVDGIGSDEGKSVAVDGSGNILVTGWFEETVTFGNTTLTSMGDKDIFIAKYDANGDFLWVVQAGGTDGDVGYGIAVDGSGNSLVTGFFRGTATFGNTTLTSVGSEDIFVAKYDVNGNFLWAVQAYGTGNTSGYGIAVDDSGNSLVTGQFSGEATFGDTTFISSGLYSNTFVIKYNVNGNFIWAEQVGGTYNKGVDIAVDASGNSLVTGYFQGNATFGDTTLYSEGTFDIFIAKYDMNGNFLWVQQAGETYAVAESITMGASGNSLVTGYFSGTATFGDTTLTSAGVSDIFVAKYNNDGNLLWATHAGGAGISSAGGQGITVDVVGNSFVTGIFSGNATFGDTSITSMDSLDIFVAKYDANSNFLWVKQVGGTGFDRGHDIAVDGSGNCLVVGAFEGDATFDDTTLNSMGSRAIFVAKLGSATSGIQNTIFTPTMFGLQQNYPNPFNPSTTIKYSIPQSSNVTIKIYDVLGNEIEILVNDFKKAGTYELQWNAENLPAGRQGLSSGVYFYRIIAGNYVETKKMILMR